MAEIKKSCWDRLGAVLAAIAEGGAKGAVWASKHPEVLAALEFVAHVRAPVVKAIDTGVAIVCAVEASKELSAFVN